MVKSTLFLPNRVVMDLPKANAGRGLDLLKQDFFNTNASPLLPLPPKADAGGNSFGFVCSNPLSLETVQNLLRERGKGLELFE